MGVLVGMGVIVGVGVNARAVALRAAAVWAIAVGRTSGGMGVG
jgi:hypothetical protein